MTNDIGMNVINQINLLLSELKDQSDEQIIERLDAIENITKLMSPQTVDMGQLLEIISLTTQVRSAIVERFPDINIREFKPIPIPKSILN